MDRRYGAWARLLALFRLIHKGGGHGSFRFIARKGRLFDPDAIRSSKAAPSREDAPACRWSRTAPSGACSSGC